MTRGIPKRQGEAILRELREKGEIWLSYDGARHRVLDWRTGYPGLQVAFLAYLVIVRPRLRIVAPYSKDGREHLDADTALYDRTFAANIRGLVVESHPRGPA